MTISEINNTQKFDCSFILQNRQKSINNKTKISHPLLDKLPYSVITSFSDIIYKLGTLTYFASAPLATMAILSLTPLVPRNYQLGLAYSAAFGCAALCCVAIGLKMMESHRNFDNPLQKCIDARTLQISHEEKNKRTALIIEATDDHNGAFSTPRNRLFRYTNILKNYKVHHVKVSEIYNFLEAIEEVGRFEKISLLWIKGHGGPNSINFGPPNDDFEEETRLTPEALKFWKESLQNSLDKNAIIVLDACSTGKPLKDEDNFACMFSKYAPGRLIYAAKKAATGVNFSSNNTPSLRGGFPSKDITVVYKNGKLVK